MALLQDLKFRVSSLERENLILQEANQDLRSRLNEIKVILASAPDLAKLVAKNLADVAGRLAPKTKGIVFENIILSVCD